MMIATTKGAQKARNPARASERERRRERRRERERESSFVDLRELVFTWNLLAFLLISPVFWLLAEPFLFRAGILLSLFRASFRNTAAPIWPESLFPMACEEAANRRRRVLGIFRNLFSRPRLKSGRTRARARAC